MIHCFGIGHPTAAKHNHIDGDDDGDDDIARLSMSTLSDKVGENGCSRGTFSNNTPYNNALFDNIFYIHTLITLPLIMRFFNSYVRFQTLIHCKLGMGNSVSPVVERRYGL